MEKLTDPLSGYLSTEIDGNKITDKGIEYLILNEWGSLQWLYLGIKLNDYRKKQNIG